jgi:hypothetical protein
MKKNLIAACGLATLLVPGLCLAGHGGDAFAGGLVGGTLGGVVGGSIAKSGSSRPDRATQERLNRLEEEQARRDEAEKKRLQEENKMLREKLEATKKVN